MSGWFPRLTPPANHVASGHDIIEVDGQPIAPLEGDQFPHGTSPVWLRGSDIQAESNILLYTYQGGEHDGALMEARGPDYIPQIIGRSGNVIAAGGGRWTVFEVVDDGPRLRFDDGTVWPGFAAPAWDDHGALFACTDYATGLLYAGHTYGMAVVGGPDGRAVLSAREPAFRYGALCWEAESRVYGRRTVDAATEDLTLAEWEAKPIPIRTPGGWWLLSHDQTRVLLRPWGSSRGYIVFAGDSDGPHDARWDRFTETIRVVWSVKGVQHDARFRIDGALVELKPPVDEPFVVDPTGVIEDTLPHLLGPYPAMARPDCATFIKSDTDAAYAEWWSFDTESIWHEFDRTRQPGDLGWYLVPLPRWMPRRVRSGETWTFLGEIVDLGGTPVPAGTYHYEYVSRIDVAASGTVNGRPIAFMHTYDPRRRSRQVAARALDLVCDFALAFGIALPRLRATSERLKGGYEKYWYGTPEDGLLRWEYWRTKDDNSGDELVHSADAGFPKGPTSLTPLPSPRPPDDEDEMTYYPNDVQMVNALGRIHVEGYLGHLQRARGIFDAPDPQQTDIHDPTRDGVYIDDDSISVWIGRYFAYFNTYTGDHERAIRAVLNDIYWSDEAQQKRGAQGGEPPTSPIQTAGRDFVR